MAGDSSIRTETPGMSGRGHGEPDPHLVTLPHRRAWAMPAPPEVEARPEATAVPQGGGASLAKTYAVLAALLVALMIGFSAGPVANAVTCKKNKDYTLWYQTGRFALRGADIYPKDDRPFPFMYPPSCAALLAPGSVVGEVPFVLCLTLINSAAWLAAILLSVDLATGRAWRQDPLLYLAPTLCVLPFVNDTFLLGQPNLLLLALMLGACACLRRHRQGCAGVLIALAAAIKAFPVMAVGYLVYRRCWKAVAAVVVAMALLLLVLPMAFRGPGRALDDLTTWTRGMVLKYDADAIAQRPMRCYSFKNQSLMAIANRLLRPIPADGEADKSWKVNVADLDFRTINALIVATGLGLCGFYLASMPRRGRRTDRTDAIEWGMLLLLILIFSPLSFNYFYVWLLYPLALVLNLVLSVRGAPDGRVVKPVLIACLAANVVLLALAIPFRREAQAYGNLFFASLLLLVGLGWGMRRMADPTSALAS